MIKFKAKHRAEPGFRCLDCRSVQKNKGPCIACESENMKDIMIHYITPKAVVAETRAKQKGTPT